MVYKTYKGATCEVRGSIIFKWHNQYTAGR